MIQPNLALLRAEAIKVGQPNSFFFLESSSSFKNSSIAEQIDEYIHYSRTQCLKYSKKKLNYYFVLLGWSFRFVLPFLGQIYDKN